MKELHSKRTITTIVFEQTKTKISKKYTPRADARNTSKAHTHAHNNVLNHVTHKTHTQCAQANRAGKPHMQLDTIILKTLFR